MGDADWKAKADANRMAFLRAQADTPKPTGTREETLTALRAEGLTRACVSGVSMEMEDAAETMSDDDLRTLLWDWRILTALEATEVTDG